MAIRPPIICPSILHVLLEAEAEDWRVHKHASCDCFGRDQKLLQALIKTEAGRRHLQSQGGDFKALAILSLSIP